MHQGKCHLCLKEKDIQLSHVLPKFMFKWHKRNSPSYLRSGLEPNKRVQDGDKDYLFCKECEQLFSKWEDKFAREVFQKLQDPANSNPVADYKEWALKFATSLSFRVAIFSELKNDISHFPDELKIETQKAKEQWRKFLLGRIKHPGKYEQHLLHLDVIQSYTNPKISNFLSRYFIGAVHTDMLCTDHTAFTFAKMFRVVVLGHISEKKNQWKGTIISPKSGTFGGRDVAVPEYVLNYMSNKADELLHAGECLSNKQQEIIEENAFKNAKKMLDTSMFRATISDRILSKRNG